MGSQGTAKGVKAENVGQVEKPYQVVAEIYEFQSGQDFFHEDPGWDHQEQLKERKLKMPDK